MTDSDIERTTEMLLCYVREAGAWLSGDQRVSEETASELLGVAPGTLRNWRYSGKGPISYGIGNKPTYRLENLAEFIESSRES